MGLYDARSEDDFHQKLSLLRDKWEKLVPGFHKWFQRFQSADFKQSMISSVREASQLIDERNGQHRVKQGVSALRKVNGNIIVQVSVTFPQDG